MEQFHIQEFYGIQQQTDGALLPVTSAADARNMDTSDGNLSVANGYAKHLATILPGTDKILKLIVAREATEKWYVVTANKIYAFVDAATDRWDAIYTFSPALTSTQIDYVQTQIGTDDYLIIATGETQMIKVKISTNAAEVFGTGEYSFSGTVSSYNAGTLTITLSATLTAEAQRHAVLDGITVNGTNLTVASATSTTVTLSETPDAEPASPNTATIRGGGSDAECNFCDMYFGRFFAAGDPDAPCRLYWSAVSGSGRTIEDWLAVTGSADASGGYVEVGDASGDAIIGLCVLSSIMVIFKRYSVYTLRGDRPSAYVVERVENYAEHMSNASVAIKNNSPFYLTMSGIQYFDDTGIHAINDGIRYLNAFIKTLHSVSESKGCHCQNVMYFSCKVNSSAVYDDTVIVFDIARKSYMIRDGFEIADMVVHDGSIYIINANRYVYEFNVGASYDGVNIVAYWLSQPTDMSAKFATKKTKILFFRATTGSARIKVYGDDFMTVDDRNFSQEQYGLVRMPISINPARLIQLRIENQAGSAFSIRGGIQALYEGTVVAQ